jgi:serine/threonine protein kinase
MGNCAAAPIATTSNWKVIKTFEQEKNEYINDPRVPPFVENDQVIWRRLLTEPSVQNLIGKYVQRGELSSKTYSNLPTDGDPDEGNYCQDDYFNMVSCWIEVVEYTHMTVDRLRRRKAADIYTLYIESIGAKAIPMPNPLRDHLRVTLQEVSQETVLDEKGQSTLVREPLDINVFASMQKIFFSVLYEHIYKRMRDDPDFKIIVAEIKSKYNKVSPDDFEYFSPKLGEGGFGVVVRCKKISTGKIYAMKLQRKVDLLGSYRDDPRRVDLEVRVLASLHHKFLIGMDYSFQTEHFGLIAMEIAEGGTLESIQDYYVGRAIPEADLGFYVAEIADALNHIHRIGLIYRDMKAQNVLLDLSGHVKLADLGGVVDTTRGQTIAAVSGKSNATFPFAPKFGNNTPSENVQNLTNPQRRKSIMGTRGFMAPEMVELMDRYKGGRGYCYMVDWWSLGILLFVLRTDNFPFAPILKANPTPKEEYDALLEPVEVDAKYCCSPEFINVTKKFITVSESERLGFGLNGFRNIRDDPFFSEIDWDKIATGTAPPPLRPGEDLQLSTKGKKTYANFDEMLHHCMEQNVHFLDNISDKKQKWFENWYVRL